VTGALPDTGEVVGDVEDTVGTAVDELLVDDLIAPTPGVPLP
jgi:hypothetical protein